MHPWKCGAVQKPVRGVDDQGRVWAVGWVTSISELCAIYICNTHTWGIRFWAYYMVWPSGYVVGHGLGYKHQWIVCDVSEMHIHGGFGSGVAAWLGKAAAFEFLALKWLNESWNDSTLTLQCAGTLRTCPWRRGGGEEGGKRWWGPRSNKDDTATCGL